MITHHLLIALDILTYMDTVGKDNIEPLRQELFAFALSWLEEEGTSKFTGSNRVVRLFPLSYPVSGRTQDELFFT